MYEQDAAPNIRRVIWIALGFIVTVVVLWVLVWLVFFRHSSSKTTNINGSNTKQNQSGTTKPNTKGGANGNASSPPSNTGAPSSSAAAAPDQLANTGAGDVFVPFAVAGVSGSVLYYVRLRKKLLS